MTKYYVNENGDYLGGFEMPLVDDVEPDHLDVPEGAIEVNDPPENGLMIFTDGTWKLPIEVLLPKCIDDIDEALHSKLDEGIMWAFNPGETPHPISLQPTMRETLSTFKQLLDSGQTNPHGGYLWADGAELRKPDGNDLSDGAIDEICMFAGQWSLAIARIAIQEKQLCAIMTNAELQAYSVAAIDWTITWDALVHPDWTDNLVLKNP